MRRMKRYVILAMIAAILIFTMAVPKALAASVPETDGMAQEGATIDSERAPEEEPPGMPDENGQPAGKTAENGSEETGQASVPESGSGSPAQTIAEEVGNGSPEQASAGETAGFGATLDPEKAAETEPEAETGEETVTVPARQVGEEDVPEPDWLAGGTGSMEDLTASHSLMITEQYIQRYENYDLGITTNCTFDAVMDGNESIQGFICLSPGKSGYGLKDKYVDHIYEYTTPMLAKAFYYGVGPGSSVLDRIIEETRGNRDGIEEIRLIITHVAASQVYAKLHDADPSMGTSKTAYDACFHQTEPQVRQMANRFGNEIMGLSVPRSYHVYTAVVDDERRQDSGFGFFNKSVPEEAQVRLKKSAENTEIIAGNRLYSLEGAEYGVYRDEVCSDEAGTLTTDEKGDTPAITLPAGKTYYVKEKTAPEGYRRDDRVYPVTLEESDKVYTVDVSDTPVLAQIPVRIEKKSSQESAENAGSLAGTEFTISYYDGYYGVEDLPQSAAEVWVIRTSDTPQGCLAQLQEEDLVSGTLYNNGTDTVLPLGTIAIKETKAAEGYLNDGGFGGTDMYLGQIRVDEQTGEPQMITVQGETTSSNTKELALTVFDTPVPVPPEPEIGTYATDAADGDKTVAASGRVTVTDNVRYKNFTPGRRYRFEGTLMDKESGRACVSGSGSITGETTITAGSADGSVDVMLIFDAGDLDAGEYVAFEEVYEIDEETGREHLFAEHKDLNDEAQTITRPDKPGRPRKPGRPSNSPGTGDSNDLYGLTACIALCAGGIVAAVLYKKRRAN